MKIKHVSSSYVFEADDDAAKALVERGDYEKATKADQTTAEALTEPPAATPTSGRASRKRVTK